MKKQIAHVIANSAAFISMAPAKLVMTLIPDNGPGSTAYAVILAVISTAITLPVTLPLYVASAVIEGKK